MVRRVLPALRPSVHVRLEHRHAGLADSDRRVHLAQDLAADHASTTGRPTTPPRRSLHHGDDLADRELHRRRRQQGSGVRQVHRSAVEDAAAVRARDQRAAAAAAAARLEHRRRDAACRARPPDYRDFIQRSKAEFGVAKHTYVSTRSGWFSDRTECYLAAGRPALVQDTGWTAHLPAGEGLLAFSTPRRSDRRDRRESTATTIGTPGAPSRSRARTSTRRVVLPTAAGDGDADENRAHRAGRDHDPAAEVGFGRDDDLAAHRGARRPRPRRHAVRDRATRERRAKLHAHLPARLLARRAHVAVGALRDAEPRRRRRARGRVRHHPLRGGLLSDVAGLHAAVADANRPDAASFAERGRSAAVDALSRGAVRRHLEGAGAPAERPQRRRHRAARHRHRQFRVSAKRPTTTCCSSAGSPTARALLQAIEIAKRRRACG